MESQPQNPEFRINPETFHPCKCSDRGDQAGLKNGESCVLSPHSLHCQQSQYMYTKINDGSKKEFDL